MRRTLAIVCGAAAVMMLVGCVANGRYGNSGRSGVSISYTTGYYDGYYGPYSGGYWASDGYFYYLDRNHQYHRDQSRHFRRDRFQGAKTVKAEDRTRDRKRDSNQNNRRRDSNQSQRDGNWQDRDNR